MMRFLYVVMPVSVLWACGSGGDGDAQDTPPLGDSGEVTDSEDPSTEIVPEPGKYSVSPIEWTKDECGVSETDFEDATNPEHTMEFDLSEDGELKGFFVTWGERDEEFECNPNGPVFYCHLGVDSGDVRPDFDAIVKMRLFVDGEWTTETDLSAGFQITVECVGADCDEALAELGDELMWPVPCASTLQFEGGKLD